jgi:Family of unknown function (DUF6440)
MKWLLVLLAAFAGVGAHAQSTEPKSAAHGSYSRFTRETTEDINLQVETDHETGCRYLIAEGQGITPLLKSNGAPDCDAPKRGQ